MKRTVDLCKDVKVGRNQWNQF